MLQIRNWPFFELLRRCEWVQNHLKLNPFQNLIQPISSDLNLTNSYEIFSAFPSIRHFLAACTHTSRVDVRAHRLTERLLHVNCCFLIPIHSTFLVQME